MSVIAPIWLDVLDETARLCALHRRSDLVELVQQKRAQFLDPHLRVLVVGESKQGKSQLINALVNAPVCPVGDGLTTALATVVKHAHEPVAALVASQRTQLALDQISAGVGGKLSGKHGGKQGGGHVEIGIPRGLLASGIVLIDTPGVDSRDPGQVTRWASAAKADVALMVSDATRELSVSELNLLLQLTRSHARVVVALTKTDIAPHWRLIAEKDRRNLASVGVPATIIPLSSTLRLQAAKANDEAINAESGFPTLITRLLQDQSSKHEELARAGVSLVSRTVLEQLATQLRGSGGDDSISALSKLHDAQRAVEDLRKCSMRWQNTLNDETADLMSDLEYDLHDRTRRILQEVDEMFNEADPLTRWDTFAEWLEENLIDAAEANYRWMVQRFDAIALRVANNFAVYGVGREIMPSWSVRVPGDLADRMPEITRPPIEQFTPTQKVLTGLRGSYGGVLMVGLATSLVALPLINPFSLGAGALFGGKTVLDESKALLRRRQALAKAASQRHVDDFFLRFSKDCRDTVRQMQRMLRDHFAALTENLQDALANSFRRAKLAAEVDAGEREKHLRQLAVLYEDARALVAGPAKRARLESGV